MFGSGEIVIIQQKKIIVPSPVHYDSLKSFFLWFVFSRWYPILYFYYAYGYFSAGPMVIFDP